MVAVVCGRRIGVTVSETTTPRALESAPREIRLAGAVAAARPDLTAPGRRAGKRLGR